MLLVLMNNNKPFGLALVLVDKNYRMCMQDLYYLYP